MPHYFCTYFDKNYLPRGMALYNSLKRHCADFRLWVLCMDVESHAALSDMSLKDIELIRLEDFERGDADLQRAKNNRSVIEYYFTCTPSLPLFVLNHWREVELITYLDADLYFFSDPSPIYEEMKDASIAIIPHRFSAAMQHFLKNGKYNVGWLSFRRDEEGLACLRWWRERCNEWCYDQIEPDRFADQKYLNQWPRLFKGLSIIQHKGANLAPWNVANYELRDETGRILVDGQPLIFFHFHGLKMLFAGVYDSGLTLYKVRLKKVLRQRVYRIYLEELANISAGSHRVGSVRQRILGFSPKSLLRRVRFAFRVVASFFRQNLIVVAR